MKVRAAISTFSVALIGCASEKPPVRAPVGEAPPPTASAPPAAPPEKQLEEFRPSFGIFPNDARSAESS